MRLALAAALGAALLVAVLPAAAKTEATVIDRTVQFRTLLNGGIHEIEARAHSGVRASPSAWKTLPFAVVTSGSTGSAATQLDNAFVWSRETWLEEHFFPTLTTANGTLAIKLSRCRATRARVPLSRRGLEGGSASQLGEIFDCQSPRNVLVRVRARIESGAGLRASHGFLRTDATISEAALAVRTRSGRSLAYAAVAASGRTQLFTGRGCFRD